MIVWGGAGLFGGMSILSTLVGDIIPAPIVGQPRVQTGVPDARSSHTAVWTGRKMIVWGGDAYGVRAVNTGGRYNPGTDSSTATTTTGAPAGRRDTHTAVWTGSQMIVWGGTRTPPPASISTPADRIQHHTVGRPPPPTWCARWPDLSHGSVDTGAQRSSGADLTASPLLNTGGQYNPSTNSWTATSTPGAPDARAYHTAVWTGTQMIVWGGVRQAAI